MPDQETYGRFTPSAWNFIKSARLSEDEQDNMRLMIEAKTETITLDEVKAMIYEVVQVIPGIFRHFKQKVFFQNALVYYVYFLYTLLNKG